MAVIDASVAVKWFVPHKLTSNAEDALRWRLSAPALILPEIANALWKYVRAGVMDRTTAADALSEIDFAYFGVVPLDEKIVTDAFGLATDLGHPVYDCVYLALGRKLGWPVLTDDRKLVDAGRRATIDVIALEDF